MRDPASSPLRALLAVLAAAAGTTLFWALVSGDLIIMGGWLAIELRKRP